MARGGRITTGDVRRCVAVAGECLELGADARAWHRHLLERLRVMVDAQVAIGGNMQHFEPGRKPTPLGSIRTGWASKEAERNWLEYTAVMPVTRTPEYEQLARFDGPIITRLRDQLWTRERWYRSATYNEFHKSSGIDDYVISIVAERRLGLFNSVWLHRPVGSRPMGRREWWLVRQTHGLIAAALGRGLATALEPTIHTLSPRLRDTLDALLDGDSEKQVAYRLGLSPATVHEYVVGLYRHFGVRSRGELMARFVGRARPRLREPGAN